MHEDEAHTLAREHPKACKAGWLLACDAPANIAKGQKQIDAMGYEDANIAIAYRDHCLALYAAHRREG